MVLVECGGVFGGVGYVFILFSVVGLIKCVRCSVSVCNLVCGGWLLVKFILLVSRCV